MAKAQIRLVAILEYETDGLKYANPNWTDEEKLNSDIEYYQGDVNLFLESADEVRVEGRFIDSND